MRARRRRVPAAAAKQQPPLSLTALLTSADLLSYESALRTMLKLRNADDLVFTENDDLDQCGMTRPEQRRLRAEYTRLTEASAASPPPLMTRLRNFVWRPADERRRSVDDELTGSFSARPRSDDSPLDDSTIGSAHLIAADTIELCRELGAGDWGVVFQARWRRDGSGDGEQVAVKRVPLDRLHGSLANFLNEMAALTRVRRHDNVIRLFGVVLDGRSLQIVSEYALCGSLLECLQRPAWREPFAVDTLCVFAQQMADGMRHLHAHRLVHRALAARNVLVTSRSRVAIADCGVSAALGADDRFYRCEEATTSNSRLPIAWLAPESIESSIFTAASDVFAFGCLLVELFSYGHSPWPDLSAAQIATAVVEERQVPQRPAACPAAFHSLIQRCCRFDAAARPTFDELVVVMPDYSPQLLVAVVDSSSSLSGAQNDDSRLQFRRGDIIVLLDKRDESGDSEFWRGALRDGGSVGTFKAEDTIAHLVSANPVAAKSPPASSPPPPQRPTIGDRLQAKFSGIDRDRRKLLIGQPLGDLRHTCHVGVNRRFTQKQV